MKQKCMWCDKAAIRFCDAPIAFLARSCIRDKKGKVTDLLAGRDEYGDFGMSTCDAPMCAEHTHQIGHISGTSPDSIDRCPHHVEYGDAKLKDVICFPDEVNARRRSIHAEIRRARLVAT